MQEVSLLLEDPCRPMMNHLWQLPQENTNKGRGRSDLWLPHWRHLGSSGGSQGGDDALSDTSVGPHGDSLNLTMLWHQVTLPVHKTAISSFHRKQTPTTFTADAPPHPHPATPQGVYDRHRDATTGTSPEDLTTRHSGTGMKRFGRHPPFEPSRWPLQEWWAVTTD